MYHVLKHRKGLWIWFWPARFSGQVPRQYYPHLFSDTFPSPQENCTFFRAPHPSPPCLPPPPCLTSHTFHPGTLSQNQASQNQICKPYLCYKTWCIMWAKSCLLLIKQLDVLTQKRFYNYLTIDSLRASIMQIISLLIPNFTWMWYFHLGVNVGDRDELSIKIIKDLTFSALFVRDVYCIILFFPHTTFALIRTYCSRFCIHFFLHYHYT